jgi:OOP family OmpA-OmpF porin
MNRSRLLFLIVLAFCTANISFAQSKKQWIQEGDKCFNAQDYATAIAWYAKALDDTTAMKEIKMIPYEVSMANKKFKGPTLSGKTKVKKDSTQTKDSTKVGKLGSDSSKVVIKKDTVPAIKPVVETPTQTAVATISDTSKGKTAVSSGTIAAKKGKKTGLKYEAPEQYAAMQLAHSYRLNADFPAAVEYYGRCVESKVKDAQYYYGISLMAVKKYQDALNALETYINSGTGTDSLQGLAQKKQAGCFLAIDSLKGPRTMVIQKLDSANFNQGNSSFAISYYNNNPSKLFFTSARKGSTGDPKKPKDTLTDYICDLYSVEKSDSGWKKPERLAPPINSQFHEGAGVINERFCFFTRWTDENPSEALLYRVNISNGRFFPPEKLGLFINKLGCKTTHPFVTGDGKRLYFSSNRPGGMGGMDIWYCDISEEGIFSEPKNLGAPVNTKGDEVTPFLHSASNTFYFSSNGHVTIGGLDIMRAEYMPADNVYGIPANLNTPINSSKDDAYYIMENNGLNGYFTSDRDDCPGGNCYKVFSFNAQPVRFDVSGIVTDAATNEPIPQALVTCINTHNGEDIQFVTTDDKGNYAFDLKPNSEYFIKSQKTKYFADAASLATEGKSKSESFTQDFLMNTIPAGEIEISGIEYDFNSAALRPTSMANLDKIVDLLKLNDNLSVDVEANTDSRGNDQYNMKLSQARAQSCVDYLVSKGIAATRLKSKGWGETNPLIKDADIDKMEKKSPEWEAAHQKNRRTALRIVGESEIKIINKGQ